MKKKTIITACLALLTLTGWAQKQVVWEAPTIEYGTSNGDGFFNLALDVTKVELKETETVVYITASERSDYPGYWFRFASDTYLKVGDQRYTIVSADGIELDKQVQTNKDGWRDMAFHFPPLPKGTKVFDFIEGDGQGAFQFKGIKPVEERWMQLLPSYWRDDQRGDWVIAFLEDCAIYDCKFWTYKQRDVNSKTGEAKMVLTNGDKELKVTIGKNKNGMRTMQIGNKKVNYTMITSRFLPDYPAKDTRSGFVDTGYKEDTITVVGWIKDMPEHFKKQKTFNFNYQDIFDKQNTAYADLDEQGRFTVKIPVLNSSEFFCDWERCFMRTMLEPGKTYFLLYDFKEGRRYFMGEDVRLQNELFKYPLDWKSLRLEKEGQDFNRYIASVDSLIKAQYANIDALCLAHPTLSTRFSQYRKGNTLWQQAYGFGQSRFYDVEHHFSDNALKYAHDTFWTKLEEPYTLHRELCGFLRDYLDDIASTRHGSYTFNFQDHLDEIASNDEELALLNRWKEWMTEAVAKVNEAPTPEEKEKVAKEENTRNADMIQKVEKIINGSNAMKVVNGKALTVILRDRFNMLDSIQAPSLIKDIYLSRLVTQEIDNRRTSLAPAVIDTLKAMVSHPECIAMVEKMNDHYLAIENREFDKLVLKSSDNLKDLSEGEALLKKILEPYKGKFVLLDVWGTWCGPCKEALSHSTEEYARLKDYDIEFLYLANQSPQTAWENVIKEYNVTGDNVAHYNLPVEQQSAIERHLDIHAFPTYKLFDRDGNLLDLKVDARNLDGLVELLEKMK